MRPGKSPPSARWRYYLVAEDMRRNPSDYELLNAADIFPLSDPDSTGQRHPILAGARRHSVAGVSGSTSYGLPNLRATPKVFVAQKNAPLDIYGFHTRRIVSSRAQKLLHAIDPDAFDFVECETLTRKGVRVAPYFMMDIARVVDDFDETGSVFELASGTDGLTGEAYVGPHLVALHDAYMSPDMPLHYHAFLLKQLRLRMVFGETIVDAWRAARFSGARFDPLQPPTRQEAKRSDLPAFWRSHR